MLVITPITDKVYLSLSNAINNHYCFAGTGPPGSGKTETIRDLAASLLRRAVIINCGEQELNAQDMANIFKGTAMTGAWTIFDCFNKLDPTIMSAVA